MLRYLPQSAILILMYLKQAYSSVINNSKTPTGSSFLIENKFSTVVAKLFQFDIRLNLVISLMDRILEYQSSDGITGMHLTSRCQHLSGLAVTRHSRLTPDTTTELPYHSYHSEDSLLGTTIEFFWHQYAYDESPKRMNFSNIYLVSVFLHVHSGRYGLLQKGLGLTSCSILRRRSGY